MTQTLAATTENFLTAITLLRKGQSIVLPTETVYGLAAIADNDEAVRTLFTIKNRDPKHPINICVFHTKQVERFCEISPLAQQLMDAFWPGPLTLVLTKNNNSQLSHIVNAGLDTVGVRCPDTPWRQSFIDLGFKSPLALTSANISGSPSPVSVQDVQMNLNTKIPLILDGGTCRTGQASTIIAVEGACAKILREGPITRDDLNQFPIEWLS